MSERRDEDRQAPQDPLTGTILGKLLGRDGAGKVRSDARGPAAALRALVGGAMRRTGHAKSGDSVAMLQPESRWTQGGKSGAPGLAGGGALARLLGRARGYDRQRAEAEREQRERVLARLREAHMVNLVALLERLFGG